MRIMEITEQFSVGDPKVDIDEETKTIKNVAILSRVSENKEGKKKREYSDRALADATQVFEGSRVFLNHRLQEGMRRKPHDVREYVGRIKGLFVDGDRVRARELRVFNEQHWGLTSSAARHDPDAFGLSIDGEGKMGRGRKAHVVERILSGRTVDLVADPATVRGLFEERDETEKRMDLTIETLREDHKDLVEAIEKPLREAETELKKKIEELEEKKSEKGTTFEELREQVDEQRRELEVSRLVRDGNVKVSAAQFKALMALTEDADREELLKEIGESCEQSPLSRRKQQSKGIQEEQVLRVFGARRRA